MSNAFDISMQDASIMILAYSACAKHSITQRRDGDGAMMRK